MPEADDEDELEVAHGQKYVLPKPEEGSSADASALVSDPGVQEMGEAPPRSKGKRKVKIQEYQE